MAGGSCFRAVGVQLLPFLFLPLKKIDFLKTKTGCAAVGEKQVPGALGEPLSGGARKGKKDRASREV